ncbi:hypothetical protein GJ496_005706 [Pomphorhynchus laevis]|nr:hypothetical protein GJ496_005706 [Pomphorhynchus laevis]
MVDRSRTDLASELIRQYFDDFTCQVIEYLMREGPSLLSSIRKSTNLKLSLLRRIMIFLCGHGICYYNGEATLYSISLTNIIQLHQSSRLVYFIKSELGDECADIAFQIFLHSHVSKSQLLNRLQELHNFATIEKCLDLLNGKNVLSSFDPRIDLNGDFDLVQGCKRHKQKIDNMDIDPTVWSFKYSQFETLIINKLIENAFQHRHGSYAKDIIGSLFSISEIKQRNIENSKNQITANVSIDEIVRLRKLKPSFSPLMKMQFNTLTTDLKLNCLHHVADSKQGLYYLDYSKAIAPIFYEHVSSLIEQKYSQATCALFNMILNEKTINQKRVEDTILMSSNEAKSALLNLCKDKFISLSELSRSVADPVAIKCQHFFTVNKLNVCNVFLNHLYKTLSNLHNLMEHVAQSIDDKFAYDAQRRQVQRNTNDSFMKSDIEETVINESKRDSVNKLQHFENDQHEVSGTHSCHPQLKKVFHAILEIDQLTILAKRYHELL